MAYTQKKSFLFLVYYKIGNRYITKMHEESDEEDFLDIRIGQDKKFFKIC